MAERLADLHVVERWVLIVEKQIVGAEVAVVWVRFFGKLGVIGNDLVVSRTQAGARNEIELASLIRSEVRGRSCTDIDDPLNEWLVGALVLRVGFVDDSVAFAPFLEHKWSG